MDAWSRLAVLDLLPQTPFVLFTLNFSWSATFTLYVMVPVSSVLINYSGEELIPPGQCFFPSLLTPLFNNSIVISSENSPEIRVKTNLFIGDCGCSAIRQNLFSIQWQKHIIETKGRNGIWNLAPGWVSLLKLTFSQELFPN